jgi:hypothetical protein
MEEQASVRSRPIVRLVKNAQLVNSNGNPKIPSLQMLIPPTLMQIRPLGLHNLG